MVTKTVLFIVFFSIGIAAIAVSILVNDFNQYYIVKIQLHNTKLANEKIKKLIDGYNEMIKSIEADPHIVERLAPATLGVEPNTPQTAFPKASRRELLAAQRALIAAAPPLPPEPVLPEWLKRCSDPMLRKVLFLAGSSLLLISFTCFNVRKAAIGREPS
ncbi:MAG: hypothetical protein Q7T18_02615 [Sedimentisphaerales bacterium]|nr:hypothetical protein [Sedimentisphaerales bacterium]